MEERKIIGFYDYTVILTYLGFMSAFLGIACVMSERYLQSLFCLMLAGVCDMFDGTIASTKNRNACEKSFGVQIDSLCDLVSFGVLPAVFVMKVSRFSALSVAVAMLFCLCGLIRLAYYNVLEGQKQNDLMETGNYFIGLPITSSALVLPLTYLVYDSIFVFGELVLVEALAAMAVLYITPFKFQRPGFIGKVAILIIGLVEFVQILFASGAFAL